MTAPLETNVPAHGLFVNASGKMSCSLNVAEPKPIKFNKAYFELFLHFLTGGIRKTFKFKA